MSEPSIMFIVTCVLNIHELNEEYIGLRITELLCATETE
jgi:hypothetical protein